MGAEDLLDKEEFSTDINRGINGEILSKRTSVWAKISDIALTCALLILQKCTRYRGIAKKKLPQERISLHLFISS